jgi:hypothetical protein
MPPIFSIYTLYGIVLFVDSGIYSLGLQAFSNVKSFYPFYAHIAIKLLSNPALL